MAHAFFRYFEDFKGVVLVLHYSKSILILFRNQFCKYKKINLTLYS